MTQKDININYHMKMSIKLFSWLTFIVLTCSTSCQKPLIVHKSVDRFASTYPTLEGTVIPPNIAPFNFEIRETGKQFRVRLAVPGVDSFEITSNKTVKIPIRKWKHLLETNRGKHLEIRIFSNTTSGWQQFRSMQFSIAEEPIDPYIAYRLIEPGYTTWNRMGIYQRNLENFKETPILLNTLTDNNCINCHSFCNNNPEMMLFHLRKRLPGTIIVKDEDVVKVNLKTPAMPSAAVYPRWHPGGRYIAFSTNVTRQGFHSSDPNKIEVYDRESDIVIYDTFDNDIFSDSLIQSPHRFETFPEWSPDGQTLYFCSAASRQMPQEYDSVRYDLLRLSFDPEKGKFGSVIDTLVSAGQTGKSVAFARVSPDGQKIVYCLSDYGTFPVWHGETDLYMLDLQTGESQSLDNINSFQADTYHSWSSNGRWLIFASRRLDGRFTRLFISYFDRKGNMHTPFLLPQQDPLYNDELMYSYNIPEFITGKVKVSPARLQHVAWKQANEVSPVP